MILYLVSNSPGEVSTFVKPMVGAIRERHPDWEIQVCLVPCPYATGAETRVITSWPESPAVWSPWQTTKAWWRGTGRGREGAVVFLGGDPWHALLLKHRFDMPSLAYFPEPSRWEKTRWLGGFDRVAIGYSAGESDGLRMSESDGPRTDESGGLRAGESDGLRADESDGLRVGVGDGLRAGESHGTRADESDGPRAGESGGLRVGVGDLRVDAVTKALALHSSPDSSKLTLALFPGSRWIHLKAVLGSFLKVVDDLARDDIEVLLAASPFISRQNLANAAAHPWKLGVSQVRSELRQDTLFTEKGSEVHVVWGNPYEVMARCDLALSLPGTNTAELAIAGKPTVVPLSFKAPVGGGGLLGILERLPGLQSLKRHLRARKKNRIKLVALPNQLAGRVVMPEFIVQDDLRDLSDFMSDLLDDASRRAAIGTEARQVMGPPGAADRLVDEIERLPMRG